MMNTPSDYLVLFEAFKQARTAYTRLLQKGSGRTDRDLARDPDYVMLHRSGVQLAILGGEAAIQGAIRSLSELPETDPALARTELERYWAGMGQWRH